MTIRRQNSGKGYMLRVKMNDEEELQLRALAERSGMTVSSFVRAMVRNLHVQGAKIAFVSEPHRKSRSRGVATS